jgi:serine/threonine-protein kinase RsbT
MATTATTLKAETISVRGEQDIVIVRQRVRQMAVSLKLSLVDQTKMVTAASELARNLWIYGGGGEVTLTEVDKGARRGLRVDFADKGPGIPDVEQALRDGYTSGGGMGLGLGGAKRLVNEFEIQTEPGKGTRVSIVRWK